MADYGSREYSKPILIPVSPNSNKVSERGSNKATNIYTITNSVTGVTKIYEKEVVGISDRHIGTISTRSNAYTGQNITPTGKATLSQKEWFQSPRALPTIKAQAQETITKVLVNDRKADDGTLSESEITKAQTEAQTILNTSHTTPTGEINVKATWGTATQDELDRASKEISKEAEEKGTRNKFGIYSFPQGLGSSGRDIMKFTMLKYSPKKFKITTSGSQIGGFENRENENLRRIGSVSLPIPGGITDNNRVDWGEDRMNAFQAQAARFAFNAITRGLRSSAADALDTANAIGQDPATKNTLASFIAGEAAGTGFKLFTRQTGAVVNPNMELLFNAPSLRPFAFTFRLAPRNNEESRQILNIIRFFKQGMAPIRTKTQLYLKSPHTFRIQYLQRNRDSISLNRFKECALQTFAVDYTPEGQYATYKDGVMTSYQVQMQFQELEPVFNDDYGNSGSLPAEIGF